MNALKYLQNKEWSMGNGQCPECYGVPESWHGHPLHMDSKSIGHEKYCQLAAGLIELGATPLMKGDYKTENKYEHFMSEEGLFGTRLKTETGCPRYKKYCEELQNTFNESMANVLIKSFNAQNDED